MTKLKRDFIYAILLVIILIIAFMLMPSDPVSKSQAYNLLDNGFVEGRTVFCSESMSNTEIYWRE